MSRKDKVLFAGFKGRNNASGRLAEELSRKPLLLTNSYNGLKRDIDSLKEDHDLVVLFGVDRNLTSNVRIEKSAVKDGTKRYSNLDLNKIFDALNAAGIEPLISDRPKDCLCNEAYWNALEKFSGRAVFIHIPTVKHADEVFFDKMKTAMAFMKNGKEDIGIG